MSSQAESSSAAELTPAQRMAIEHDHYHKAVVEDLPDEADVATPAPVVDTPVVSVANGVLMSEKAAGKQPAQDPIPNGSPARKPAVALNTQSEEAFPTLGQSKPVVSSTNGSWGARLNGKGKANGVVNGASANFHSVTGPPLAPAKTLPSRPAVQLPGVHEESYPLLRSSIKTAMKKSLAETLNDVARGSAVKLESRQGLNEEGKPILTLIAKGNNAAAVRKVLREAVLEIGKTSSMKVPVPASMKAQLIGKGGSKIKEIQAKSGATIQLPPASGPKSSAVDDDEIIEATVEGNPIALATAVGEIQKLIGQRPNEVRLALQGIPPELYPFLKSKHYGPPAATQGGLSVKIPPYQTWEAKPPAVRAADFAAQDGYHIHVSGPGEQARQARAQLEARAAELQRQLAVEELLGIERERHQFILGSSGLSLEDFVNETGCSVIMPPPGDDTETIHIVGPPEKLEQAKDRAMDLAGAMVNNAIDISRQYQGPRETQAEYMRNLTQYIQRRSALDSITDQHNAQVTFPTNSAQPWTLWTRDPRSGVRARTDVLNVVSGHPHTRFRNVNVHPFYQRDLEQEYARHLRDQHGVHVIVPSDSDDSAQVLLVYEGPGPADSYTFPQRRPSPEEVSQFEHALVEAENYLLRAIGEQEAIVDRSVDAPAKYREKLNRFAARQDAGTKYPVQYRGLDDFASGSASSPVVIRGPSSAVEQSTARFLAFIEEQIRDEAERDYTTSCPFPKAFGGRLIGKDGETIKQISEDFDVAINYQGDEDRVEIKGPPAKAEAAKAHIISLAKKAEDETTRSLSIPAQYHGGLIGKGGSQVQRYQERYGVQIFFPFAQDDSSMEGPGNKRRAAQGRDEVVIKGGRKGVEAAYDDLRALYMLAAETSHTAGVSVSPAQIPALIGRDGQEARNLRELTGAEVDFPKSSDPVDAAGRHEIKIKGSKTAVEKAVTALKAKVKAYDDTITESLEVDKKHYRSLIGANGDNLRSMVTAAGGDATQSSRIIQIPREASNDQVIKVVGSQNVVKNLVQAIKAFVELEASRTSEIVEVPPERHGALIGPRGSVKKAIESECNVAIMIPKETVQGAARAQVKLLGQADGIAKAKERIDAILAQGGPRSSGNRQGGPGETVLVPARLHPIIADGGKFFKILKNDLNVTVDHNRQRPPVKAAQPSRQPITAAMPLITDDSSSSGTISAADIESNSQWEIVSNAAPSSAEDGKEPTFPWVLKGDAEKVANAKLMLEAAINAAENSVTGYLLLPEPRSTHSHVVGPGGATIRKIRESSGCNPRVPPAGEVGAIELSGSREKVEMARELIMSAVVEGLKRNRPRDRERGGYGGDY